VPAESEPLLTVGEVAARLRVSKATVYKLCTSGRLPAIRVLNAVRIAPTALQEFLGAGPGSR
jgi:excisionase family DNA binding protein